VDLFSSSFDRACVHDILLCVLTQVSRLHIPYLAEHTSEESVGCYSLSLRALANDYYRMALCNCGFLCRMSSQLNPSSLTRSLFQLCFKPLILFVEGFDGVWLVADYVRNRQF